MEAAITTVGGALLSASFDALFQSLGSLNYARQGHVADQLRQWENMLHTIFLVLEDAEEKQMAVPIVKKWFNELRDLAYDVDDILDEFATNQALRRRRFELARTTIVSKFLPACCARLNLSTFKFNADMISRIEIITARLDGIIKQKDVLLLGVTGRGNTNQIRERLPSTSVIEMNEAQIYGREKDKKEILERLNIEASDVEVSVLPIVGMGGVGKTTLSQLVFNDTSLEFDFKAWVSVGVDFDVLRITKTILQFDNREQKMDLNWHQMRLRQMLHQKKCLIVLDDVWTEDYGRWTLFCGPLRRWGPGSRIIVTTRHESVSRMVGSISAYPLKELSSNECLSVFAQHALGEVNFDKHVHLEEIGKEIVRRCQGLPLAAKTLGGLLRGSPDHKAWKEVLHNNIWDLPDDKCSILPALRLSYFHLPSHLKQCFAYCAIFPKHFEFNRNELVLWWMAEGFVNRRPEEMIESGCQYFDELLSRSFFQVSSSNESQYVMHDLIHDLAQSVSGETCFHLGDKQKNKDLYAKIRHSSFNSGDFDAWQKFKEFLEMKNLRTFLALPIKPNVCFNYLSGKVLNDMLPKLRSLRVLSLAGYRIVELPCSIGGLKRLRYLNLSGTVIERLPESIVDLLNLQTLRLRGCYRLAELPLGIGNLINLQCLDISECYSLTKLPLGFRNLTNLQCFDTNESEEMLPQIGSNLSYRSPLKAFTVGEGNGLTLTEELKKLSKLQRKLCLRQLEKVVDVREAESAELKEKDGIEELELEWSGSSGHPSEVEILSSLRPHQNLSILSIQGFGGSVLPSWIADPTFNKMVKLSLGFCKNITLLPQLGKLPSLRKLSIDHMDRVKEMGVELYGDGPSCFASLETLSVKYMKEWEQWQCISNEEAGAVKFPKLRDLQVIECPKLVGKLPIHLSSLQKLCIGWCQEALVRTISDFASLTTLEIIHISGLVSLDHAHIEELVALRDLKITDCRELKYLWKDGTNLDNLASLRSLNIRSCDQVVSLVEGEEGKLPYNLHVLEISSCWNLEKLANGLHRLSCLRHLKINYCAKLKTFPASGVPHGLRILEIDWCNSLECVPEGVIGSQTNSQLEELIIRRCSSLTSSPNGQFPISLKTLCIQDCNWPTQLYESLCTPQASSNGFSHLTELTISKCPQLQNLSCLPLNLSSLQSLNISGCECLESLPSNLSSLQSLNIYQCYNLRSLPNGMQNLTSLELGLCGGLESFAEGGLPLNLTHLCIYHCQNLKQSMSKWGLHTLTSLQHLKVCGAFPSVHSFPENNSLLPSSLSEIEIHDFENLKLVSRAILNLTSLTYLHFSNCPSLRSFPQDCLPPSLERLWIWRCPLMEKWYLKHRKSHHGSITSQLPMTENRCQGETLTWVSSYLIPMEVVDFNLNLPQSTSFKMLC